MCRRPWRCTGGFTLTELLVVIAIIGILTAILLPAVQRARETSRKSSCQNNLRQLAVGCQNFLAQWEKYPSGGWGSSWTGDPNGPTWATPATTDPQYPEFASGSRQPGGWIYSILPYLGEQVTYELGKGVGLTATPPRSELLFTQMRTKVETLYCPSRRRVDLYECARLPANTSVPNPSPGNTFIKTDYAANAGTNRSFAGVTNNDWIIPSPGLGCWTNFASCTWPLDSQWRRNMFDGVIGFRSEVTPDDVKRGLANTLLVGEKHLDKDSVEPEGPPFDAPCGDGVAFQGHGWSVLRWTGDSSPFLPHQDTEPNKDPQDPPGPPPPSDLSTAFGSAHDDVFQAAFCDGSVRRIEYGVNSGVWSMMGRRKVP
jgi:prepilin-type N-terminal cleavage/methylation domain-containing protein